MKKSIEENVQGIRARISAAAARAGRDESCVRLLAATKYRDAREIMLAVEAGVDILGENRVQELLEKRRDLGDVAEWHFIGHVQRNKVKSVVSEVSLIHSLDSVRLAEEIGRRSREAGLVSSVLAQVNVAGESSKTGFSPGELVDALGEIGRLTGVRVVGLSTMAPLVVDPEDVRWVFIRLRELRGELEAGGLLKGGELSMGMTNDFEVAVEEGSSIVRIGTAIFEGA